MWQRLCTENEIRRARDDARRRIKTQSCRKLADERVGNGIRLIRSRSYEGVTKRNAGEEKRVLRANDHGHGQIGVGGSIGYWQKTARPFVDGADLTQPNPERQRGNKTTLRLVPTELTATYRLTALDDDYGVPVVPYIRGGLAYYIWWMTAPSGNISRVCNSSGEMCGSKALGASLGVTGAIGLAIRAERVDATAAMSMRQSGIQHAGIYAELSLAKVDGFGSDKKLSVGDRTWFAGVDFEF